jgi:hypothetical protein
MTLENIEEFKKQALLSGYTIVYNHDDIFYKINNNWEMSLQIIEFAKYYTIEAHLYNAKTKHSRTFITDDKDIIGPIEYWAKCLVAFNEFIYNQL